MAWHIKSIYGIVVSWLIAASDILLLYCKSREFHILDRRHRVETLKNSRKTNAG